MNKREECRKSEKQSAVSHGGWGRVAFVFGALAYHVLNAVGRRVVTGLLVSDPSARSVHTHFIIDCGNS